MNFNLFLIENNEEVSVLRVIRVKEVIDESKLNRFHYQILFWCSFIIVFDGYDLFSFGAVVPSLMEKWQLTPVQVGAFNTYTVIGMMLGAVGFGILADRIGRRTASLICIFIYSVFTFFSAFAIGAMDFSAYRFITGIGLGGIMPNLISLMIEYSPKSRRSSLAPMIFIGMSVGAILASLIGMVLIPLWGWKSVFIFGAIPLLFLPYIMKALPESVNFLHEKKQTNQLSDILNKINSSLKTTKDDRFEIDATEESKSISSLFTNKRAFGTIIFWIVYPMVMVMTFGLATWLPKLMLQAGYSLGSSLSFLIALHIGAILGTIIGGKLGDKIGLRKVLILYFALSALGCYCLGIKSEMIIMYVVLLISGACTFGTQNLLSSFVAQFYPSEIRGTGTGSALAIGRLGAMAGPILGGIILSLNVPMQWNFIIFAVPGLIAAIAIWLIRESRINHLTKLQSTHYPESK
ncbi:UNVERIFIED_CONTAM: AAHS family benzoate transporter-like MFS transporter [Brevibacillus sp. OAP136]